VGGGWHLPHSEVIGWWDSAGTIRVITTGLQVQLIELCDFLWLWDVILCVNSFLLILAVHGASKVCALSLKTPNFACLYMTLYSMLPNHKLCAIFWLNFEHWKVKVVLPCSNKDTWTASCLVSSMLPEHVYDSHQLIIDLRYNLIDEGSWIVACHDAFKCIDIDDKTSSINFLRFFSESALVCADLLET
jgi:hypothetical protein